MSISKAIYNGNQYEVISTNGETSKICPRGGGFVGTVKTSALEMVDAWESSVVEGFTSIDGGVMYPCMCDPDNRWNGWACPTFSRETIKRVIAEIASQEGSRLGHEDGNLMIWFDGMDGEIIFKTKDGRYGMDGWCWDFYTPEEMKKRNDELKEIS